MIYKDTDILKRNSNQSGLYDLFTTTFINNINVEVFGYVVAKEEEMRIDKISEKIYGKIEFSSFLCNINFIKNPLSIKTGDILLYVTEKDIDKFTPTPEITDTIRQDLLGNNKINKIDKARKDTIVPQKDALPPTIKKETKPNIIIDNVKEEVILGPASANERPAPRVSE